jgi:hypothetical protein
MWRTRIVALIRKAKAANKVNITNASIEAQYQKNWIVHFGSSPVLVGV